MRVIKAGEFKAKCLKLMDEVAETGEAILITKNGTPVAQLAPVRSKPKTLYGALEGSVVINGDIVAPVDVPWDAMQ